MQKCWSVDWETKGEGLRAECQLCSENDLNKIKRTDLLGGWGDLAEEGEAQSQWAAAIRAR